MRTSPAASARQRAPRADRSPPARSFAGDGRIDSALLQIELDYASLYANAIALQALQRKLQRRIKAQDLYYRSPSLLNLIEGPYILEVRCHALPSRTPSQLTGCPLPTLPTSQALHAARSIIQTTVHYLAKRDLLKCCPSRIFQRMLFAATFLYKVRAQARRLSLCCARC